MLLFSCRGANIHNAKPKKTFMLKKNKKDKSIIVKFPLTKQPVHILASSEPQAFGMQTKGSRANVSCLVSWQQCRKNSLLIRTADTNGIMKVCQTALTEKRPPTAFCASEDWMKSDIENQRVSALEIIVSHLFFFYYYPFCEF